MSEGACLIHRRPHPTLDVTQVISLAQLSFIAALAAGVSPHISVLHAQLRAVPPLARVSKTSCRRLHSVTWRILDNTPESSSKPVTNEPFTPNAVGASTGEGGLYRTTAPVDAITVSVIQHRLTGIVEEMGEAMLRTSFSQILNSSRDFSMAICGASGEAHRTGRAHPRARGRIARCRGGRSRRFRGRCARG